MPIPGDGASGSPIAAVLSDMQERLDRLPPRLSHQRVFLSTYQRTTQAVGEAIARGHFEDPGWVERWDVAFAELYLTALDTELDGGSRLSRPWRLAFAASPDLHPLQHVLLGINAHINYDLPQALLAVISDDDFSDSVLIERRRRDHERIDAVLSARVSAEDAELAGRRTLIDRLLTSIEPARLQAVPQRGPSEGLAQHAPASRRASLGRRSVWASIGGARTAQRREDRGPAPAGPGPAAAGCCRLRRHPAASRQRCRGRGERF